MTLRSLPRPGDRFGTFRSGFVCWDSPPSRSCWFGRARLGGTCYTLHLGLGLRLGWPRTQPGVGVTPPAHERPQGARVSGLVSIGYEGRTAKGFADELALAGVTVLADVRLTPLSRKPGFSKTALAALLAERGIRYVHLRALGNPRDNREPFHAGRVVEGRARFRELIDEPAGDCALETLAELARTEWVAVLCFEAEVDRCHRHVVLEETMRREPSLAATFV